ncbi:MAG: STAS domain-containing protein [Anaerolineales bacterium]|nr:STAS domain-containing protein [Anaerolineales bacterium]
MGNSDFKISNEQIQQGDKPVTIFHLRGWLDAQSENNLVEAAQNALTQGTHYLVLNMSDIDMLTSAGIRAIQKVHKLYSSSDQPSVMRLCSASPQVYHVLSMTGFLQTVPMYETTQAALKSLEM